MEQNELNERIKLQQQVEVIENQAKGFLDSDALLRYGNIKVSNPEKAVQVAVLIVQAVQRGQIKNKLSDNEFKELLIQLQGTKKEFKMVRK